MSDDLFAHASWAALKQRFRITWPCPCLACSPKYPRIAVSPTGPTAFDVSRTARERHLTPEQARELLLEEAHVRRSPLSALHADEAGRDNVPVSAAEAGG